MNDHFFDKDGFHCYYISMFSGLLKGFKDLIYPNYCLVCNSRIDSKRQEPVCGNCWESVEKNLPPFCSLCGRHLNPDDTKLCPSCLNKKFNFDRAFCPCLYTGTIKKLIHEFKYSGKDYLGRPLGSIMNTFIRDYNLPMEYLDFIVPVPLHQSRLREREFNQAEILSRHIGKEFSKRVLSDCLIRTKATKTQTELGTFERLHNMEGSFEVKRPQMVKGANLLLIDDVMTTGATSNEAAKSLKKSGAAIVLVMALAN